MLVGILYHAALSFSAGFPWMVQDAAQGIGPFVFQAWVHGFRMQLFMVLSGFFTAMLWRRKGLKALLKHRCQRVLLPCLLGLVTVVPAMGWAVGFAAARSRPAPAAAAPPVPAKDSLWAAVALGDIDALGGHLSKDAGALTNLHPQFGLQPLHWASLNGRREVVAALLDQGALVDARTRDGHSALHGAAFLGHAEVVALLLERGADVNAASRDGELPLKSAAQDLGTVRYIAGLLGLPVDEARWKSGREAVRERLLAAGARERAPGTTGTIFVDAWRFLTEQPVFILVWFLWFLVWLVALFVPYALVAERLGWRVRPGAWVLSPLNLLWLTPLTMIPTAMMEFDLGIGADTAMGIVPMPHVLLYYALFFFFGALYHDCDDRDGRLGASWRWMLPVTVLGVFPLALEFATGRLGFRDALLPTTWHRPAAVLLQSVFAWTMSFASIGLFGALLTRASAVIRYLSDSSYWLYLAHLPLCIAGQAVIAGWPGPVWIKLPLFSGVLTGFLLLTYQLLVRNTWIGRMLNGPRGASVPRQSPVVNATPLVAAASLFLGGTSLEGLAGEVRITVRPNEGSMAVQADCGEGTHRVVWQTAERLEGPWRSIATGTVTQGRALMDWKPTGTTAFLRAIPKATPGFLERLDRIRTQVRDSWPEAALLESHLLISDWVEGYPEATPIRAIFSIENGTVTAVENTPGADVTISIADRPWLGSQTLAWPIAMELDLAESRLREAGYGPAYRSLTLRQPVYPGMIEPYWIFGTSSGFVFVGSKSGSVRPGN